MAGTGGLKTWCVKDLRPEDRSDALPAVLRRFCFADWYAILKMILEKLVF